MRDYGKVHSTFWSSATTGPMSDDGKMLALYLMTCSHSTITGVFRLPDGYVSEDLGWGLERVSQGFAELLDKGFANRCETTKWVWVSKHLEWNKPENPNQRKSAAKIALSIPDVCGWKLDFMRVCGPLLEISWSPTPNPFATVPKPFLNQEQEQEQKQEQDEGSPDLLAESEQPPSEFSIPLNDSTEYQVPLKDLAEWKLAFQAVDVEQELRQIRAWSLANKSNRKTKTGVNRFIVRWLSRAQDNPRSARRFDGQGDGIGVFT